MLTSEYWGIIMYSVLYELSCVSRTYLVIPIEQLKSSYIIEPRSIRRYSIPCHSSLHYIFCNSTSINSTSHEYESLYDVDIMRYKSQTTWYPVSLDFSTHQQLPPYSQREHHGVPTDRRSVWTEKCSWGVPRDCSAFLCHSLQGVFISPYLKTPPGSQLTTFPAMAYSRAVSHGPSTRRCGSRCRLW